MITNDAFINRVNNYQSRGKNSALFHDLRSALLFTFPAF